MVLNPPVMWFVLCFMFISQVKAGVEEPWDELGVWRSDLYLSFGVLGLGVLSLLAITSLPAVGNILTWREFTFVQVSSTKPFKALAPGSGSGVSL